MKALGPWFGLWSTARLSLSLLEQLDGQTARKGPGRRV
jgi:hypothetical protein